MKRAGSFLSPEAIESFLRLHELWEGITSLPPARRRIASLPDRLSGQPEPLEDRAGA